MWLIWLATKRESSCEHKTWTSLESDHFSPAINASYSVSLLVILNVIFKARVNSCYSELMRSKPTPTPLMFTAPSVYRWQKLSSGICNYVVMLGSGRSICDPVGISAKKSAITCPLIAVLGLKRIVKALISTAHFANLPNMSGLFRIW